MKTIAEKNRYLKHENKRFQSGVFVEIPRSQWGSDRDESRIACYRSSEFLVQVFSGEFIRLSITRTMLDHVGNWRDGITWDEMQSIKNGCGFAERDAVEIFPRETDVVNVANVRHIWIVPEGFLSFVWRSKKGSGTKSGLLAESAIFGGAT